jgi:arylsulfatase A-like enzyme
LKFIDDNKERPFFAYVAHNTIHSPEIESDSLISKYERKENAKVGSISNPVQAAMLETLDKSIKEIIDKITELDLDKRTVVIFFSDNGQLAEKSNKIFNGSKGDLYEGGIHMPLIIRWTRKIKAGTSCDELLISNDFYSTIIDIASGGEQKINTPHGKSFVPYLMDDETPVTDRSLYWHYPHYHGNGLGPQGAVRKGKYKLIEWYEKSYFDETGMYELYDLENDPGEMNNLSDSNPEKVLELVSEMKLWKESVGAQKMKINYTQN